MLIHHLKFQFKMVIWTLSQWWRQNQEHTRETNSQWFLTYMSSKDVCSILKGFFLFTTRKTGSSDESRFFFFMLSKWKVSRCAKRRKKLNQRQSKTFQVLNKMRWKDVEPLYKFVKSFQLVLISLDSWDVIETILFFACIRSSATH